MNNKNSQSGMSRGNFLKLLGLGTAGLLTYKLASSFKDKNVFMYHQDLSSKEMLDDALSATDYWMPHFYELNSKSTKKGTTLDFSKRASNRTLDNVISIAERKDKKIMPMISAFDEHTINYILNNPNDSTNIICEEIKKKKVDGVTIDFESVHLDSRQSDKLTNFMKILRSKLSKDHYKIAVAVSPRYEGSVENGCPHHGFYDYDALAQNCDYIHLMCYDFHKGISSPSPVMPADKLEKIMQYSTRKIPSHKIVALFPLYGNVWRKKGNGYQDKGVISENFTDEFLDDRKVIERKYVNGELYIKTKDNREIFTQDAHVFKERLATLDKYGVKNVGGWRQTHGSRSVYRILRNWA